MAKRAQNHVRATALDKAIGYVSPRVAADRLRARREVAGLTRGYDGTAKGRLSGDWHAPETSADAEIGAAGPTLRRRARDLSRNNPHAAKAVSALTMNAVGTGITPTPVTGDASLDARVAKLWDDWAGTPACDADGQLTFRGLQTLAFREMVEAGEVLLRMRPRRDSDGLPVPLQIQMLEAEQLDASKTTDLPGGRRIVQGVEMDALGRRRAYWLLDGHPGDVGTVAGSGLGQSRAVPARNVAHMYEKQRQQTRGVPWGAPVMRTLRDLDQWREAEIVRKRAEASVAAIVMTDEAQIDAGIAPGVTNADDQLVETFAPGMIAYAHGGKDIKFNEPTQTSDQPAWLRAHLHILAAGYRVPYELLTGDLSQVNFSSIRAGLVEFRRMLETLQWQVIIPSLCQPVWDWFTQAAFDAGLLPRPDIAVAWQPPRFEAVDAEKDAKADIKAVRAGLMSLSQAIQRRGYNPTAQLAEIARDFDMLDDLGIVLDSDPRRTSGAGVFQDSDDEDADGGDQGRPPSRGSSDA